jgi:tRNA(Arg) A34 adenosine deaminase TadA
MSRHAAVPGIRITCPDWVRELADFTRVWATDEERVRLAIRLARENVLHDTGGPFGAAVFERASGRLVGVGVNRVVPLRNSSLHAEIVAFMTAQARVGSYTLAGPALPEHELFTSCEPCAMCLGATLWSGVRRVTWAATREDAFRLTFDEGPVFPESYDYLRGRGIEFRGGLLREEAREVFELYQGRGGEIYNG